MFIQFNILAADAIRCVRAVHIISPEVLGFPMVPILLLNSYWFKSYAYLKYCFYTYVFNVLIVLKTVYPTHSFDFNFYLIFKSLTFSVFIFIYYFLFYVLHIFLTWTTSTRWVVHSVCFPTYLNLKLSFEIHKISYLVAALYRNRTELNCNLFAFDAILDKILSHIYVLRSTATR